MNNSAGDDDVVLTGHFGSGQRPISMFSSGRGADSQHVRLEDLLAVNEQLLGAVGDAREFERAIFDGARQLRAAASRITELHSLVTELQQRFNERRDSGDLETRVRHLTQERDRAINDASGLRIRLEQLQAEKSTAERAARELDLELQLVSARAALSEKAAASKIQQIGKLQSQLGDAMRSVQALEIALDSALRDHQAALQDASEQHSETAAWIRECEALMVQHEADETLIARLDEEQKTLLSALEERNSDLLNWLGTAEQLNARVEALEETIEDARRESSEWHARADALETELQSVRDERRHWHGRCEALEALLAETREERRHWHGRCEALEALLADTREERRHWHGRCEALEVHLKTARAEGQERAAELQAQLDAEKNKSARLQTELGELADRFTKLTQVEIERTRSEIMHVSAAINNVQAGRAWRLKHWVRRLTGRR